MSESDHNFKCPACGEEGIATLPDEFMTFGCPAECGASFAKYRGEANRWEIKCVVQPVFIGDDGLSPEDEAVLFATGHLPEDF